jgi:hypothetical protein
MTKVDVKKLIDGYRKAQELLTQKETAIDDVTVELENVVGRLTQSELENRRLMAAHEQLQKDRKRSIIDVPLGKESSA